MRQASKRIPDSAEKTVRDIRPAHTSFRTAIENCGVGAIPIDEINGAIGLSSKCEIPDERSVGKLTQGMGLEAITLWVRVQKLANTNFGLDLIGRNSSSQLCRIATVTLARRVLGELTKQPEIGAQQSTACPRNGCRCEDQNC
jgi:hypothetical protein